MQDREAVELQQYGEPDQRLQRRGTPRPPVTLTWPEGIGRERVRATCASRSRSTMSFQVQPQPRITKAPTKNSSTCQGTGSAAPAAMAASPADHQHGISNSQAPIGRSKRASRR